ncbi:MAG: AMP-binding protein, partial [Nocardioidaceae bacterium]
MTAHLADLLTSAAAESPDRVALVESETGRRVTWAELEAEVDRVAQWLNGLGLVAGYRVVIAMGNRVEFVTAYLGALRARLVAVPVNPRAATGELVRMIADCG